MESEYMDLWVKSVGAESMAHGDCQSLDHCTIYIYIYIYNAKDREGREKRLMNKNGQIDTERVIDWSIWVER